MVGKPEAAFVAERTKTPGQKRYGSAVRSAPAVSLQPMAAAGRTHRNRFPPFRDRVDLAAARTREGSAGLAQGSRAAIKSPTDPSASPVLSP